MEGSQQAPPGWYDYEGGKRWWDGTRWTEHVAPSPQLPAPAARVRDEAGGLTSVERLWGCGAFAATIIGSLGPWATLGVFSKPGTDADGSITLVLAAVGILAALVARPGGRVVIVLLGLVILGTGIADISDVSNRGVELFGEEISPSVGWGLWVVTLSGGAAILCGLARPIGIVNRPEGS